MAQTGRNIISTNCGICHTPINVDVTNFASGITIENNYNCQNGHIHTCSIRDGAFLDVSQTVTQSDIDTYQNVPDHIKDIINEAYMCQSWELTISGACVVRRLLDELLYHHGFDGRQVGTKVSQLQKRCNESARFERSHPSLCDRTGVFRTVADLAGFQAHAQGYQPINVLLGDFNMYLYAIETEIKTMYPEVT